PDDPPVEALAGVPRLMRDHAAYRRLLEIYPSDANAIEFCQGTFSEMPEDVYDAIRYFGSRNKILYLHFRNVSSPVPSFREEFHQYRLRGHGQGDADVSGRRLPGRLHRRSLSQSGGRYGISGQSGGYRS